MTRAKARTSNTSQDQPSDSGADRFSPDWPDIAVLPSGREDSDNDPGSPFVPSRPASPHPPSDGGGESDLENDEETFPASLDAKQSQKARSPRWLPWEDRYLAQQAEKLRLFAQRGDERRKAWDGLAVDLLKASTINGKPINRTGPACRARLEKLLDAQRREQTRSLQLTGTNQEVDDHLEAQAGLATPAMNPIKRIATSLNPSAGETNSLTLSRTVMPLTPNDSNKRASSNKIAITNLWPFSIELSKSRISSGIGKLTDGMAALANAQAALLNAETNRSEAAARMQYEDSERRRIDAEHRAAEAERHASLLAAVSHKK
ncbi:hypothetical protein R3P38DRAFT_2800193 [Favolaschia claudopus]|uniref:Myb-like domain-containing protein n=1 Tax=Favolaschia claudopus TaxID=2862362 RepID=A0AAV9ZYM0_9AGAR